MLKTRSQESWLSSKWWIIINLAVLPFAGLAIFIIAGFVSWGASFNGFDLQLWVQLLPGVIVAGGVCGAVLGLLQGFALRSKCIRKVYWVIATSLGMAIDAVLAYGAWQLFSLAESKILPAQVNPLAYTVFVFLAVFHGCSLGFVQWIALRREGCSGMALWPWLAGLSWSFLTPFLYVFTMDFWMPIEDYPFGEFGVIYFPFLMFSLPYVLLTTVLWTTRRVN